MATNSIYKSDLNQLYGLVQSSMIVYPKEIIIQHLRDFFSKDSLYHYVKDEWGFSKKVDHTDLPLGAGLFDKKVIESDFVALPNLKSAKNIHNLVWELTFSTATDMRPTLFDFAQANNLRTLQIVLKSKNLEQIFREKTGKR